MATKRTYGSPKAPKKPTNPKRRPTNPRPSATASRSAASTAKRVTVPRTAEEKMAADAVVQSQASSAEAANARVRTVSRGAIPTRKLRAGGLDLLRYSQGVYTNDPFRIRDILPGTTMGPPRGSGGRPNAGRRNRPTGEQQPRNRNRPRDTSEQQPGGGGVIGRGTGGGGNGGGGGQNRDGGKETSRRQRDQAEKRRQAEARRKAEAERRRREREKKKAPRGPGPVAS